MINTHFIHTQGIVPRKQRHVVKAEANEGQYGKEYIIYILNSSSYFSMSWL